MFNSNNGYSLADIAAATDNNSNDGFGFGNGAGGWWIALLFLVFAFGGWGNGNGFGSNGNNGTPQMVSGMNTDYLSTGIRDLTGAVSNDFYALNTGILNGFCDVQNSIATNTANVTAAVTNGFNTQNLANLQNTNAIQRDIYAGTVGAMQNTQAIQSSLAQIASDNRADTAQLAYNQATNTCTINTNAANNTRDIVDTINAGNRAILDVMAQNKVDAMQDKINDLQEQLQTANFLASQANQNQYLIDQLGRKAPIPAYTVANPYCNCGNYGYSNMANV